MSTFIIVFFMCRGLGYLACSDAELHLLLSFSQF